MVAAPVTARSIQLTEFNVDGFIHRQHRRIGHGEARHLNRIRHTRAGFQPAHLAHRSPTRPVQRRLRQPTERLTITLAQANRFSGEQGVDLGGIYSGTGIMWRHRQ